MALLGLVGCGATTDGPRPRAVTPFALARLPKKDGPPGAPPLEIVIFDAPVKCADWPGGVVWNRPPPEGVHFALAIDSWSARKGERRASFYPSYADGARWLDRSYHAPDEAVDMTPKVPQSIETLEGDYDALLCE